MRYIGGKSLLLEDIDNKIQELIGWDNINSTIDIFAGSGVVSRLFKSRRKKVLSNDLLTFAFVLNRGSIGINESLNFNIRELYQIIVFCKGIVADDDLVF